uniref:DDE Tnp4 domain-containing protein n=1 Tax=Scylla olivacea TaxID=85551 RepID=A0A0P4VZE0_SCYOL
MAGNEELLLVALLAKKKSKRRSVERKVHVHPILSSRMNTGAHHTLFNDLCADEKKFFNYFRMSKPSFEELLSYVRRDITGTTTNMRECIAPDEKLDVTLRYLATGDTMTDLQYQYRLGVSTIAKIIREVCKAIWERVKTVCFPDVTERLWLEIAAQFYQKTDFPHCLGALDGKHIRVIKPENSGSLYYNYKNYFSILLLAVCDASHKFIFIDVGAYGKSSDSTVFKESKFFRKLENQTLNVPAPQESYSGFGTPMPFVFVADEAFGLSQHIVRPYAGKFLSQKKRIFNYRLSRARRLIECSFGILANKWRIFHRPLNVSLSLAEDIIKACCVLHNFVRDRDGVRIEDTLTVEGLFDMEPAAGPTSRLASHLRNKICGLLCQ